MANALAFAALADPTRRAVFERLADGPKAVGDLAQGLPVSRPAVSQHLKVLKEAGLVTDRPEGARLFGGAFHLQAVGDIHLHRQSAAALRLDLLGDGMGFVMLFAIGQQHIGPGVRQTQRDGRADSARTTRDHGAFTLQRKPFHLRFSTRLAAAAICGAAIS